MRTGNVLEIQRFSVHDGPGIRTLVFMKGCPLRCTWCSNPESQKPNAELSFIGINCSGCGNCIQACPVGAITMTEAGLAVTDRTLCNNCGNCIDACAYGAREMAGRAAEIEEVLSEVEKDREFYANSGGGVTVGGGEPSQQYEFVRDFLRRCHERWLHTALETCGYAPWEHLRAILEHVDFLFYDIKHMDPVVHRRLTGASNDLVLENIRKITASETRPEVVIRIPVIPGQNDSTENITATARFVTELGGVKGIELLPYHRLATSKYEQFGMEYRLKEAEPPSAEQMNELQTIIETFGLGLNG